MTIKDRNLKPGTKLTAKYRKEQHTCLVIAGEGDKIRYCLEDGREFKSPSAAGMAITGHACDGWMFWSLETVEAAATAAAQESVTQEAATTVAENAEAAQEEKESAQKMEQTSVKKSFKRTPNQRGVSEGQTRWYCQECGESFMAPYGEIPLACPQGHKA
jgi:hypothetical protein